MNNKLNTNTQSLQTCVSDSCDCFIGFLSDESLSKSNVKELIEDLSRMQPIYKQHGLMQGRECLTPLQIIDNRKGYVSRFKYCPKCGTKVDWKTIVNNCR